jgi:hypothetical protein
VDKWALFCGAASASRDAFGCTRMETELTSSRCFKKKFTKDGASSRSFAAAAEEAATRAISPSR